jgi:hypothetical protein
MVNTFTIMPGDSLRIEGMLLDAITGIQFEPYGPSSVEPSTTPTGPETPTTPLTTSDFNLVNPNMIVVPAATIAALFGLSDLSPDIWYKVVLINQSTYQPGYLLSSVAVLNKYTSASIASASLLDVATTVRDAHLSTLIPQNVIPKSQYSVSHFGFNANATQATYTGPTWTAGPDNASLSTVAKAPLFGGMAAATGLTGWSGRKYFKLTPNTNNVITTSYQSNWMYTFIFAPPSTSGDWSGDPYYNQFGPFMFDLGVLANGGFGLLELYMNARGTSPWPMRLRLGVTQGNSAGITSAINIASPTPHALTVAKGSLGNIKIKLDSDAVVSTSIPYAFYSISGGGTVLGTSSYYALQDSASTNISWSNGVIYESRFCTNPALATDADLDALHAAIMV